MGYLSIIFNKFHEKRDVEIINEFRDRIGNTLPYQKLNRRYTYKVSSLIEDIGIYNKLKEFSFIEYKILKSRYKKDELSSEEYIKARINSNYGKYFDREVYLGKQYYYHLANYKNIYYKYINKEIDNAEDEIDINTNEVNRLLIEAQNKKIDLSWDEYRNLVNGIIPKIFDNYIPMDEKILEGKWNPNNNYDWDEDNYIIRYFNKSLDGYIKMYANGINGNRYLKGKKKNCIICGKEIIKTVNNKKYCLQCSKFVLKQQKLNWKRRKAESVI